MRQLIWRSCSLGHPPTVYRHAIRRIWKDMYRCWFLSKGSAIFVSTEQVQPLFFKFCMLRCHRRIITCVTNSWYARAPITCCGIHNQKLMLSSWRGERSFVIIDGMLVYTENPFAMHILFLLDKVPLSLKPYSNEITHFSPLVSHS